MSIDAILYRIIRIAQSVVPYTTTRTRVALVCDNKVLLVKNRIGPDRWTLPGGGVKRSEERKPAACREIQEELHITIPPTKLKHIGKSQLRTGLFTENYLLYAYKLPSLRFKAHRLEIRAARWFELESLPRKRTELVDQAMTHLT